MTDHDPAPVPPLAPPAAGETDQACEVPVAAGSTAPREKWNSAELLGDRTEVLIQHGAETYRLRRTRQDKLILYK